MSDVVNERMEIVRLRREEPTSVAMSFLRRLGVRLMSMWTGVKAFFGFKNNVVEVPWPMVSTAYKAEGITGSGGTGVVYYAYCWPRKEHCAIKLIKLSSDYPLELAKKEVDIMINRHTNIIPYYTSFVAETKLWIVMKFMKAQRLTSLWSRDNTAVHTIAVLIKLKIEGSLYDIIKRHRVSNKLQESLFTEETIATILKEVLQGVSFLHSLGIIHRDIKSNNILVDSDGTVSICDFGYAARIDVSSDDLKLRHRSSIVGTPCWMAPEMLLKNMYDTKIDIWALGIVAMEMAKGCPPHHAFMPDNSFLKIMRDESPTFGEVITTELLNAYGNKFKDFIRLCLTKQPERRPTAEELLKHPFFKKAKGKFYLVRELLNTQPSESVILTDIHNLCPFSNTENVNLVV